MGYWATLLQMCQMLLGTLWHWQSSDKFSTGYQRILATRCQIPERALATFENSTYMSGGRQYPLILCQKVLITLQSSCQRVLNCSCEC
jgi:hypothetical protein